MSGHIRRRKGRDGNTRWQARWIGPDHREHARTFDRRVDAERHLASQTSSVLRGEWVNPRRAATPFRTWGDQVMASRLHVGQATAARDESIYRNHVLPRFDHRPLGSVRALDIQAWVNDLAASGLAPTTVRRCVQLAAAVFDAAVRDRLIAVSPVPGVTLPKLEHREMRFLSEDQLDDLLAAVDPTSWLLVATAAYTGLRFGELGGLQADSLDPLKRRLRVTQNLQDVQGRLSLGPPKTSAGRRTVTLPASLADALAEHISGRTGFVFTSPEGGPIRRTNFRRRVWTPATGQAGLAGVRFHDLRHTHVAMLIAEGEHPKVIQARLGHASIRTTLDLYGHLMEGLDEAAAAALDARFRSATDTSRTRVVAKVIEIAPGNSRNP
jgi:integrase